MLSFCVVLLSPVQGRRKKLSIFSSFSFVFRLFLTHTQSMRQSQIPFANCPPSFALKCTSSASDSEHLLDIHERAKRVTTSRYSDSDISMRTVSEALQNTVERVQEGSTKGRLVTFSVAFRGSRSRLEGRHVSIVYDTLTRGRSRGCFCEDSFMS